MIRRILTGSVAATAALLLVAGTALGGGWATIAADETAAGDQPRAGETDEFGFTVLQHGVTPAGFVEATLVVEDIATGKTIRVAAAAQGAEGHFVAKVKFPEAGYWSWRVDLTDLLPESPPRILTVLTADGSLPQFDPSTALTMVERAKADLRSELDGAYGERVTSLETSLTLVEARASSLERQRDALGARVEAAESAAAASAGGGAAGGVPIAATLALALLGGGVAGFVMTGLGRRAGRPEAGSATTPEYVPTTR